MLTYALVFFGMAALGGFVLAGGVLRGKLAPWVISLGHAAMAMTGIVLLSMVVLQGSAPARVTASLALLLLAGLGGFYLATLHRMGEVAPRTIIYAHAALALLGVLILFSAVLA